MYSKDAGSAPALLTSVLVLLGTVAYVNTVDSFFGGKGPLEPQSCPVRCGYCTERRGGGGGGGVTVGGWCGRLLAPHPLAVHAPGQSLNLSECQFHHLQIHTENTAEGGQPTERGGTERGCQGEAGWAASRRPPGIRVNLASSLEVRSSVQARASNVTHHEGAHFFRGPVNTALAADSNLSALLLIQSEKSGHQESSLGKAQ